MDQKSAVLMTEISALHEFLNIPGMSIRVMQHGRSVIREDLGWQDFNACQPMDVQAIFPLASLTKLVTSVAVYRMQELGKVELYDSVPTYLKEKVPEGTRLVQLLTHTSSLSDGSMFHYDGGRFGLLKKVIEHEMEMDFPQALEELVFQPAGIEEVYFLNNESDIATLKEHLVTLYHPEPGHFVCKHEIGVTGSSGLAMTADTFVQFEQALFAGKIIASETCEDLVRATLRPDGSLLPTGKGLFVQYFDETPVIWSFGQEDGLGHLYIRFPQDDCSVVILSNSPQLTDPARLIYGDIRSSLFFEPCLAFTKQQFVSVSLENLQRMSSFGEEGIQQLIEKQSIERLLAFFLAKTYQIGNDTAGIKALKQSMNSYAEEFTALDYLSLLHLIDSIVAPDKVEMEWEQLIPKLGEQLLQYEPLNPYVNYYLARHYLRLQLVPKAKAHFKVIDQFFGGERRWYWIEACFELGNLYLEESPDQARKYFNNIITLNWNYCDLLERSRRLLKSMEVA